MIYSSIPKLYGFAASDIIAIVDPPGDRCWMGVYVFLSRGYHAYAARVRAPGAYTNARRIKRALRPN